MNKRNADVTINDMVKSMLNYVDEYNANNQTKADSDEVNLISVVNEYDINQMITDINKIDLMDTLKNESKIEIKKEKNSSISNSLNFTK